MEQRINVTPGAYDLSFLIKGESDLEANALMICTRNDWYIVSDGKVYGYELDKKGPFDWERVDVRNRNNSIWSYYFFNCFKGKRHCLFGRY